MEYYYGRLGGVGGWSGEMKGFLDSVGVGVRKG